MLVRPPCAAALGQPTLRNLKNGINKMHFKSSFRLTEQLSREQRASPPAHPSQPAVCPGITVLCSGGASVRLMSRANELSLTEVRSSREGSLCVGHSVGLDKSITAGAHIAESPSGPTARKGLPPSSAHSDPPPQPPAAPHPSTLCGSASSGMSHS